MVLVNETLQNSLKGEKATLGERLRRYAKIQKAFDKARGAVNVWGWATGEKFVERYEYEHPRQGTSYKGVVEVHPTNIYKYGDSGVAFALHQHSFVVDRSRMYAPTKIFVVASEAGNICNPDITNPPLEIFAIIDMSPKHTLSVLRPDGTTYPDKQQQKDFERSVLGVVNFVHNATLQERSQMPQPELIKVN